jgi:hypothetical protein
MDLTELRDYERRLTDLQSMCVWLTSSSVVSDSDAKIVAMVDAIKTQMDENDQLIRTLKIRNRLSRYSRVAKLPPVHKLVKIVPHQYIYIATTNRYSQNNQYKVGSTSDLTRRIRGYQTGRPKDDRYFYTDSFKCYNAVSLERKIGNALAEWKDCKNSEMYMIDYNLLKKVVEFVCSNNDISTDELTTILQSVKSQPESI